MYGFTENHSFNNFHPPTNKVLSSKRLTAHNSLASYHLVHGDNKPFKTNHCPLMHLSNLVACSECDEAFLLFFSLPFILLMYCASDFSFISLFLMLQLTVRAYAPEALMK